MAFNIQFFLKVTLLLSISFNCLSNVLLKNEMLCIPDSPPYSGSNFLNNGPLTELIVNSFKLSNIDLKLTSPPWARIMFDGKNGKCMIAGLWPSAERKEMFYFSKKPVVRQTLGLYIKKDKNIESISNGLMAVQRSTYLSKNLSKKDWTYYEVRTIAQGAQMLALSRVDALYAEVGRMNYLLLNEQEIAKQIKLTSPVIEYVYGYLAISKQHKNAKKLIEVFDKNAEEALRLMKNPDTHYLNLNNYLTE